MSDVTNPTDPRIEAAFRAAWDEPCLLGDPIACHPLEDAVPAEGEAQIDAMKAVIRRMVEAALKAADAAAWRPIEGVKDCLLAVLIEQGSDEGPYIGSCQDGVWCDGLDMVEPTHYLPLPSPPTP